MTTDHVDRGVGSADAATRPMIGTVVLVIALVLTGLSAGFFYTYEASVTPGLALVDDPTYVQAFQAINEAIRNAAFGLMFFGAVPALALAAAVHWSGGGGVRWLLMGALGLYLVCLAITAVGNVPLNEELAEVVDLDPASAAAARLDFEDGWNRLNLARTAAVVASFIAVAVATALSPRPGAGAPPPAR